MVQPDEVFSQIIEPSPSNTTSLLNIDEPTFESEIDVVESLEIKLWNSTPFSHFYIVVFVLSKGYAIVNNVGKVQEDALDLLLLHADSYFEAFDLLWDCLGFFHLFRGILFLFSRLRDR